MSIDCNKRRQETRKAVKTLWDTVTKQSFFSAICSKINEYLNNTSDPTPYNDAITMLVNEGFTYSQAEEMLKFAFPELGDPPGSGW